MIPIGIVSAAEGQTASVLVFPVLDETDAKVAGLATKATTALEMAIDAQDKFSATKFSPHSPLVNRAVTEGRLRQVDVEAGEAADRDLALFIGNVLKFDYVVIGVVQGYEVQNDPHQVKIILSGQAYAVKDNIDEATDEVQAAPTVFKAFGVSGVSSARAGYTGSDTPLMAEAIRACAYKAAQTLAGEAADYVAPQKSKSKAWKWILYGLAVGLLVIGVNNSSSSDTPAGPAEEALPITNLRLATNQTNIVLSWNAPTATTLTILRYEVARQIDNGGFSVLPVVGPGEVSYSDSNTLTGTHTYQYRVRVLYTNSSASEYTYSGNLLFTR